MVFTGKSGLWGREALQTARDLYTGFVRTPGRDPKRFDPRSFWRATDEDCVSFSGGRFARLLRYAKDQGLVDVNDGLEIALTPRG